MHVHIVFVQNFKKNTTSDHTKKENQTLCGHTSPTYKKENQTLYIFFLPHERKKMKKAAGEIGAKTASQQKQQLAGQDSLKGNEQSNNEEAASVLEDRQEQ